MKFSDYIERAGRRNGRGTAFCDFLTFSVCALSKQTQEEIYLKTAKRYNSEEMTIFSEAFACMINDMDNHGEGLRDCLGDYFMEILSSERAGQFFTPEPICDLMALMTKPNEKSKTVYDCCCGSGRMLLSTAKINRNLEFYGADIDLQCCQITLINMCLNGLFGKVFHMNSLSTTVWRCWEVVKHPIYNFPFINELEIVEEKINLPEVMTIQKPFKTPQLELLFENVDLLL